MSEFWIDEGCWITVLYDGDPNVSLARARVEPGVTTALHVLDVEERYVIERGSGTMTIGERTFTVEAGRSFLIPAGVAQRICNEGTDDLVFLCICTPAFQPAGYRELEPFSSAR